MSLLLEINGVKIINSFPQVLVIIIVAKIVHWELLGFIVLWLSSDESKKKVLFRCLDKLIKLTKTWDFSQHGN